jgi:hypothetical protein
MSLDLGPIIDPTIPMDHRVQRVTGGGPEVGTGAVTVGRIRTAGGDGAVALTDGRAVRSLRRQPFEQGRP